MDTLVGNVMGIDSAGRPITPVFTYADTRNAADAQELRRELGQKEMAAAHDRTGCLIHTSYLPARFRWLARTMPDTLAAAVRWASIGEYVLYRFLGEWKASYSVASWSGLLNRRSLTCRTRPGWRGCRPNAGASPHWATWMPRSAGCAANGPSADRPWLRSPGCRRSGTAPQPTWAAAATRPNASLLPWARPQPCVVVPPNLERVPPGLWLYRVGAPRVVRRRHHRRRQSLRLAARYSHASDAR